jgi:hypothetical protein
VRDLDFRFSLGGCGELVNLCRASRILRFGEYNTVKSDYAGRDLRGAVLSSTDGLQGYHNWLADFR